MACLVDSEQIPVQIELISGRGVPGRTVGSVAHTSVRTHDMPEALGSDSGRVMIIFRPCDTCRGAISFFMHLEKESPQGV